MSDSPTPYDETELLASITRLSRDLRNAAHVLSEQEARFLVDSYYAMQRDRIRAGHQLRTLSQGGEPNDIMGWLGNQRGVLERQIARVLDEYSAASQAGSWARSGRKGIRLAGSSGLTGAGIGLEPRAILRKHWRSMPPTRTRGAGMSAS